MGITIHYNGKFKASASISEMIEEVKDIVEIYKWNYHIYSENFPTVLKNPSIKESEVYGISFSPPGSEAIWLTFLENRRLCFPSWLGFLEEDSPEEQKQYLFMAFTKTQYAGVTVHKLIVHLLKYLKEKYFEELNVYDEGNYWDTNDEKIAEETFKQYTALIDSVADVLCNEPMLEGEDMEEYFKRVLKKTARGKEED